MNIISMARVFPALLAAALIAGCGSNDPDVLLEQGIRAYGSGRYRTAARALEKAVRLEPRHAAAQLWCGVALWKSGHDDRAIMHFMTAAQLEPSNPLPLEYAAFVQAERGEWLEVAKRLNEAFRRMPDSPRILNAMGVASLMRGNPSASHAQLAQALRVSPQYAPVFFNEAILARDALKSPDEARRLFERYLELAPDGDKAESARKALEALSPSPPPAPTAPSRRTGEARAAELMKQAHAAVQRKDHDEAAVRLLDAVEAAPGSPDALWELARLYDVNTAQPSRATETYRAFIRGFSDDPRAAEARLRVNALAGRRIESPATPASPPPGSLGGGELVFRKPEIRNPQEAKAALQRGAQYYQKQDWDRALFDFKRAVEADDSMPEGYFNLGLVYWCQRDFEHARQMFQNALSKKPGWSDARCMLARVYLQQKLGIKAVEHLNEILKTDPSYADAYYELGNYHRGSSSRKKQVRAWYTHYLQLAPHGQFAPQVSAWLTANP